MISSRRERQFLSPRPGTVFRFRRRSPLCCGARIRTPGRGAGSAARTAKMSVVPKSYPSSRSPTQRPGSRRARLRWNARICCEPPPSSIATKSTASLGRGRKPCSSASATIPLHSQRRWPMSWATPRLGSNPTCGSSRRWGLRRAWTRAIGFRPAGVRSVEGDFYPRRVRSSLRA